MWVWACSLRTGSRCQISDMNQTCLLKHPHLWLTSVSVAAEFWTRRERPPLSLTLLFFSTMSLLSSPERPDLLPWDSCSRWPLSKVYILFTLTHQVQGERKVTKSTETVSKALLCFSHSAALHLTVLRISPQSVPTLVTAIHNVTEDIFI